MFGLPPVRVGGLVRYAQDLMAQQMQMGEDVYLLLPGILPVDTGRKVRIYKSKRLQTQVPAYAIYNPLPVPMCNGILDVGAYTRACDGSVFQAFLRWLRPDIIHVHTFMGLHREFLDAAGKLGIPTVFTTHDYFGICPTAVMMSGGGSLCTDTAWDSCGQCCQDAFPRWRLCMEQSKPYRLLRKNERMVYVAKKAFGAAARVFHVRSDARAAGSVHADCCLDGRAKGGFSDARAVGSVHADYHALREYYASMYGMVSYFHFNSTLAAQIYQSRLGSIGGDRGGVVPISHQGVADRRKRRTFGETLRIGYIGGFTQHKGFFDLLDACAWLSGKGCGKLELHVYSGTDKREESFVKNHPGFTQRQLGEVMDGIDALAMPSRWPETFGLAALEAVSFGVPAILSKYVGAKDILKGNPDAGFVYDGTGHGLRRLLMELYQKRELLERANAGILKMDYDFSYERHVRKIMDIYEGLLSHKSGRK